VHAEDLLIDESCNRETIETVGKCFPKLYVVPTLAFVIKTVDSVNGCTFMVSS
jgi:hypothetical protein